jgi:hypothetical protein
MCLATPTRLDTTSRKFPTALVTRFRFQSIQRLSGGCFLVEQNANTGARRGQNFGFVLRKTLGRFFASLSIYSYLMAEP